MAKKWFQHVDEDGSLVTNVNIANVDIEDVVALRKAGLPHPTSVFENGALTEALEVDSSFE
ncbi:Crinkler (CRN) [Phytophthora megakarya]|uniref:Crinkler (CRN) n=1 Tax=Phytophthora megakarya TaxID=4795 RepID=A0A225VJ67_9STRA|nr:Crinkler (CRN) [Phytophthora megakarya]